MRQGRETLDIDLEPGKIFDEAQETAKIVSRDVTMYKTLEAEHLRHQWPSLAAVHNLKS